MPNQVGFATKTRADYFLIPNVKDWSLPISQLLRDGTIEAHQQAENSQGAAWLTGGQLDRLEYVRLLMMLHQVYSCVSQAPM